MDVNFPLYIEGSLMHSDIYGEFSRTYWNALANPLYIEGKMHIHIYQYISISGYCPFNLTSPGGPWYGMVFKEGLCGQCGKYALSHTPITDYAAQDCIWYAFYKLHFNANAPLSSPLGQMQHINVQLMPEVTFFLGERLVLWQEDIQYFNIKHCQILWKMPDSNP